MKFAIPALAAALALGACATTTGTTTDLVESAAAPHSQAAFEADRRAILAMQGEYAVTFDFEEIVPIAAGYELAEPKVTPARELVIVVEDTGDFIMLQHLLIVGEEDSPFIVKHWRQDWRYEPDTVLAFQGHDDWTVEDVPAAERAGAWSQTVYQVDDSPRYAATARWDHAPEASTWEPPVSWRPLPRRDATTRDDYDVIAAVNRHTVTEWGWSHEQDNSKLILSGTGEPRELVREHGINTYTRTDLPGDEAAADYWESTRDYWARVREAWDALIARADTVAIEDDADGTLLYGPMLSEAQAVHFGLETTEEAWTDAVEIMQAQITADGAPAEVR